MISLKSKSLSLTLKFICILMLVIWLFNPINQLPKVESNSHHFNKLYDSADVGGLREMCPDGKVGYVVRLMLMKLKSILKFLTKPILMK